mgnify:CR=1 FL=1
MAMSYSSYKQGYRGSGKSTTTKSVQPGIEIVLNKQEVIYTDAEDVKHLINTFKWTNNTNNKSITTEVNKKN